MLTVLVCKKYPSIRISESIPQEGTQFVAKGYAHINVTPSLMLNTSSSTSEVSGGWAPAKSPRRSGGVTAAGC